MTTTLLKECHVKRYAHGKKVHPVTVKAEIKEACMGQITPTIASKPLEAKRDVGNRFSLASEINESTDTFHGLTACNCETNLCLCYFVTP